MDRAKEPQLCFSNLSFHLKLRGKIRDGKHMLMLANTEMHSSHSHGCVAPLTRASSGFPVLKQLVYIIAACLEVKPGGCYLCKTSDHLFWHWSAR